MSFLLRAWTIVAVSLMVAGSTSAARGADKWDFLKGTIWYVPVNGLPAVVTSARQPTVGWVYDQTVYSIDDYKLGYFWGYARVQVWPQSQGKPVPPDRRPMCFRLAGSVNPAGSLDLSFAPKGTTGEQTSGNGTMGRRSTAWTMNMQMTSGTQAQMTHWAEMAACPKTGHCTLPGISGADARQFLAPCRS